MNDTADGAGASNIRPLHTDKQNGQDGTAKPFRQPPHNAEVEQALIGAILRNNRAIEAAADLLAPSHFYVPEHQRLYGHIKTLIDKGQVASPATLSHIAESDELLREAGGTAYLYELATNVVTVLNSGEYAKTIHDLYLKRELIGLGEEVVTDAYDSHDLDFTADKQIEKAEQRLYNLASTGNLDQMVKSIDTAAKQALLMAEQAFKRDSHVVGITTGFRDVDERLGGLHGSDLLILAGRPAMGKTALATNIAYNAASAYKKIVTEDGKEIEEGGVVLFFSLEMSAEQLAGRLISTCSGVASDRIRRGDIQTEEFERIVVASQELSRIPLYIDDTPALTITGLRQRARRVQRQHGLHLIIVDYLQLLQGPPDKRIDNRVQEVSEITRGLKTLAKELNVPVLALSQLSRQVENREDKRPQLSDLRESGSIEQDADVVSFVYRPEYYLEKEFPEQRPNESPEKFEERRLRHEQALVEKRNVAELVIAKQRHGPVGIVELFFNGELTLFDDLDRQHGGEGFQ
ncbi:replicative DNA helicase [Rhodospirillaceae bacterium KN72]|uniref:Replicative DNA helicase n=2 Tax=Pacificispira spongiicola TaxID=2729598 RepID=A0A7Y0DZ52_9PROT|nr:replicative DNA helicase [Pacificispira spongiicola]